MNVADQIRNLLLSCGFSEVFSFSPSALDCAEPIVVTEGAFARESRLAEEERGCVPVTVMVVREIAAGAESVAIAAEHAVRGTDWEPYADAGSCRIVGIDATAPAFKERDSSGQFVWSFGVACTVVRLL